MEDKLIGVELAKLARIKGFNIHCDWRFDEQDNNKLINWKDLKVKQCIGYNRSYSYKAVEYLEERYYDKFNNDDIGFYISAPTQSLLTKWLREVHKISVLVEHGRMEDESFGYFTRIYTNIDKSSSQFKVFEYKNIYEEALEIGLIEALNLIPDKI